jgi:hypothetical protein
LIFADVARALAFALLALGIATGVERLWMVFGVAFIVGSMTVVFDSGLQAMLPLALTDDMLVTANSRLQLARTLAMVAGPAVGGVLAATGGFALAFLLNAATFLGSAIFLTMVRQITTRAPEPRAPVFRAIAAGLRFLWNEARLRWATAGATLVNLVFAPLEATLVLFAQERLGLDLGGTGLLFSAHAVIGALGLAVAPQVARRVKLGHLYVVGMLLFGGGFVVVAFTTSFWVAGVFGGIGLVGIGWLNVALYTLRQRLAPSEMLGRVITASRTLAWIGIPAGAAGGAAIAEVIGVASLYRFGATAVLALGVALLFSPLWRDPGPVEAAATPPADAVPSPDATPLDQHGSGQSP